MARYWGFPSFPWLRSPDGSCQGQRVIRITPPVEGLEAGHIVDATLTTDPASIERTILISGRYDPAIGKLAEIPREKGLVLHAAKSGNTGGMIALNRHSCHGTPVSLPDYSFLPHCRGISGLIPPAGLIFVHIASVAAGNCLPGWRSIR